jgi:hypothetical protein
MFSIASARMTTPEAAENISELRSIIEQFPTLNQNVFKYIIKFLQLVGAPANEKYTKMSFKNIAIVWSPTLFRCTLDDPVIRMQNTKYETTALHTLLASYRE